MHPSGGRVRRHRAGVVLLGCALLLCSIAQAKVEEDLDYGNVYAIQTRAFKMNHEFSLSLAFLPLDAFYKYFGLSGHYVFHFNNIWAWEAVHFTFTQYLKIDTGLKKQLIDNWEATPIGKLRRLDMTLDTNLMVKPFYGKLTLMNGLVIYSEAYFLVGVGTQKYQVWRPAFDVGMGMRIYINKKFSLRLEVREYVDIENNSNLNSTLYFGLGICYNAFADDEKIKRIEPDAGVTP
jgi:outer membrane beta-barrel protein